MKHKCSKKEMIEVLSCIKAINVNVNFYSNNNNDLMFA